MNDRQNLNKQLHEQFKSLKEQAPEAQKKWKQDLENYEKQVHESMKEQKMTLWQLATKVIVIVIYVFFIIKF